ncbi:MAG TPA: four helix bundle protein [Chitinophagales bacterium]|nr:four helix bundle protein [Chitinophagales bacterium]
MEYTLETLEVYKLAEELSDKIWNIVVKWDYLLRKDLGSQLTSAADSVSANIAEGYGRHYYGESKNFYFYARGSLLETKSWLGKCKRRKIIDEEQCDKLLNDVELIMAKLINYIKFVQKSQSKTQAKKK